MREYQPDPGLEEVCQNAVRLVSTVVAVPSRVRVQRGDIVVDLEWAAPVPGLPVPASQPVPVVDDPTEGLHFVCAPTVGTFYAAPEPGAPPFVSPGSLVERGQQVAILESMKLMNPIEAECAGTVVEILAGNGESVEYEQRLIGIRPADHTGAGT
ncbi:MAG TPA: biotin/lipoyl-containing protein [Rugosimonospora sp.]|nr:biotin/lipoyl-containing protein [Rugosimonospora sp.]